jgi:hypothetical protein
MSSADDAAAQLSQRILERISPGIPPSHHSLNLPETDPEAIADQIVELWRGAVESLVLACFYLMSGLNAFADAAEKRDVFLRRLVTKRVFSENDALARLKANGKLAMLAKIGRHAATLLQPSMLCLLSANYSTIYQICLLIEEVGVERAQRELSKHRDYIREDIIKMRAELTKPDAAPAPVAPLTFDDSAAQLFALRLLSDDVRIFASDYADKDTLDECLRRPPPADDAGLVALVSLVNLGTFERALMPLLGFGKTHRLYFQSALDQPDVTDHDVIVIARRGNFRPQLMTAFSSESARHEILTLATFFFPGCHAKCQMFAEARADGWSTLIGDENWIEKPSVR